MSIAILTSETGSQLAKPAPSSKNQISAVTSPFGEKLDVQVRISLDKPVQTKEESISISSRAADQECTQPEGEEVTGQIRRADPCFPSLRVHHLPAASRRS